MTRGGCVRVLEQAGAEHLTDEAFEKLRGMKDATLVRLNDLIEVDDTQAAKLMVELFPKEAGNVVAKLEGHPRLQFKYLNQVMMAVG